MEEDKLIQERKEKVMGFLKQKYNWIVYLILAIIVYISVHIRTRNLPRLRDITTGNWALGPDLDPFLFLRWMKYIVAHGSIMANDALRYVPLGFDTRGELLLHPYMMAWFHNYLAPLFGSTSVEHSAVLYPVFFFAITIVAFFLLVRKMFIDSLGLNKANAIALISSFFLTVIPSLLPRTIAGIPEKESAAFFFLFMALYFFLFAWKAKSPAGRYSFSILAGLFTAGMALIWGGVIFIFLTLSMALLFALFFGQIDGKRLSVSIIWLVSSLLVSGLSTSRFSLKSITTSTTTLIPVAVVSLLIIHQIIFNTGLKRYFEGPSLSKVPRQVISLAIFVLIGIIVSASLFGFGFIFDKLSDLAQPLIAPITDRLGVTVAENRQPFFSEWESNFGPHVRGIALFFWLFFIGSICLFYYMLKSFGKKERLVITIAYIYFLFAIIFSRYTENSIFNGTNMASILFYLSGVLVLIGSFGYYYYNYFRTNQMDRLKNISFGLILLMSFFFLGIVSARGGVRLIMVLAIPTSVIVAFFAIFLIDNAKKNKDSSSKMFHWAFLIIVLLSLAVSGFYFYNASIATAQAYVPSSYTNQWQESMSWVRENTPQNAVFAHWWDYGYWVQTMGERATVLDGGNAIAYWDYLMGRYALTGSSNSESLEFLYSHNVTHFLIDSTDIGKYTAFSSIGSDENYDRRSWITTFNKDSKQSQETKNSTLDLYAGGFVLDEDIFYSSNGTSVNLPASKAGVAAIILERDLSGKIMSQPIGIFIYQGKQYRIPLRYVFDGEFIDFESGIEAGVYMVPQFVQTSAGNTIDYEGSLLYLSNKTVKSQLARLYLYDEENEYFKLAHTEDNLFINQLKQSNSDLPLGNFLVYNGQLMGPIKIWEVSYPDGLEVNPEYIQTSYPDAIKARAY